MITVPSGTKICVGNLKRTAHKIIYCSVDYDYADVEFTDEQGNYGHYKSSYDGGIITFPNGVVFDFSKAKEI